jgi:hypothetical protein
VTCAEHMAAESVSLRAFVSPARRLAVSFAKSISLHAHAMNAAGWYVKTTA